MLCCETLATLPYKPRTSGQWKPRTHQTTANFAGTIVRQHLCQHGHAPVMMSVDQSDDPAKHPALNALYADRAANVRHCRESSRRVTHSGKISYTPVSEGIPIGRQPPSKG